MPNNGNADNKKPAQRSGMLCLDFQAKSSAPPTGSGEKTTTNVSKENGGNFPTPQPAPSSSGMAMGFDQQSAQFAQFMGMMMQGFQNMSQPHTSKKRAHEMSEEDSDRSSEEDDDDDENHGPGETQRSTADDDPMEKLGE